MKSIFLDLDYGLLFFCESAFYRESIEGRPVLEDGGDLGDVISESSPRDIRNVTCAQKIAQFRDLGIRDVLGVRQHPH